MKYLVPPSDKLPHRAMHADREYWRSTSTGFRRMDHYELEDAFGRRLRPVLRLQVEFEKAGSWDTIRFRFLNEGRGLARHSRFTCFFYDAHIRAADGHPGIKNVSGQNKNQPVVCFYDPHMVVHPNELYSDLGFALVERANVGSPLKIGVRWYAENMKTKCAVEVLQPSETKTLNGEGMHSQQRSARVPDPAAFPTEGLQP